MSAPGFPWVAERAASGQPSLNSLTLPPSLTPLVLKQDTMFFVVFFKTISFVVVVQFFVTPMDCSNQVPSFVLHHLPKFADIHAHWVDDAIQPSHPLLPPSPPALSLLQHQG